MRHLFRLLCVCALGMMPMAGCSETGGDGGTGGTGGDGGTGGTGGDGGTGGTGGTGGARVCQTSADCDDGRECSEDYCIDGFCRYDSWFCPCEEALSDYCAESECPTWDQALADVLESCDEVWSAEAGTCGDGRYIATDWHDSFFQNFNAAGVLVAHTTCTDCDCIECSDGRSAFCAVYGLLPDCERKPDKVLCGGFCKLPLSDYCSAPECPTWDETIADVRESCDSLLYADAGRCGDHGYIRVRTEEFIDGSLSHRYFDASGALVAAEWCLDFNTIECGPDHFARCKQYGPLPDCEHELEEVLCE